ncbi:putative transcription factor B3-Domain family [Helianthus annuus]|nr:putative transcription factor B3-Domain family [Helianthus annuus]KAJ0591392.1 putative transcription factor B3-Domain family [Helianthus annuus]
MLIYVIFLKEIPNQYSNRFLLNTEPNNQAIIKCVNGKEFEVLLTKHKDAFVFMDGWEHIVAKLSFTEGCFLMFKQIDLYSYLLTPFKNMQDHPIFGSNVPLFTSMSTEKTISNVEYFCQRFTQESNDNLLDEYTQIILADFVEDTIRLPSISKLTFKVHVNLWDSFDVMIQKDRDTKVYFLYDSWDNVVSYVHIYPDYYFVMRYIFKQNFQLIVYDLNGCEILVPKRVSTLAAEDVEVSDSEEDKKGDPDYNPIEFEWKYDRRFRLNVNVAEASRIDMTMEMYVQNLAGVDTLISFRADKHGGGFRYEALEWRTKFTKPNGINSPAKCTFVYCPVQNKLILKKVVK